jgi:hypothetical protein
MSYSSQDVIADAKNQAASRKAIKNSGRSLMADLFKVLPDKEDRVILQELMIKADKAVKILERKFGKSEVTGTFPGKEEAQQFFNAKKATECYGPEYSVLRPIHSAIYGGASSKAVYEPFWTKLTGITLGWDESKSFDPERPKPQHENYWPLLEGLVIEMLPLALRSWNDGWKTPLSEDFRNCLFAACKYEINAREWGFPDNSEGYAEPDGTEQALLDLLN